MLMGEMREEALARRKRKGWGHDRIGSGETRLKHASVVEKWWKDGQGEREVRRPESMTDSGKGSVGWGDHGGEKLGPREV